MPFTVIRAHRARTVLMWQGHGLHTRQAPSSLTEHGADLLSPSELPSQQQNVEVGDPQARADQRNTMLWPGLVGAKVWGNLEAAGHRRTPARPFACASNGCPVSICWREAACSTDGILRRGILRFGSAPPTLAKCQVLQSRIVKGLAGKGSQRFCRQACTLSRV